ncbi:MAG: methyltransferase domain-containing protein [Gammaproteobacteria bacterium]|nr:methyltransferase domain-containing protein [Gammaproteobacteria bacterium]
MSIPTENPKEILFHLLHSGQADDLESACNELLTISPNSISTLNYLGIALKEQNKFRQSIKIFDQVIKLKPDYSEAYHNRGLVFSELGLQQETFQDLYKSIQLSPEQAHFYNNIGIVLQKFFLFDEAIESHITALTLEPQNKFFWVSFSDCIKGVTFTSYNETIADYLLKMYDQDTVHPKDISRAVISMLYHHPDIANALKLFESNLIDEHINLIATQLSSIALLIRTMELSPIADLTIEKFFTQIRKSMLLKVRNNQVPESALPFFTMLSIHCYINEYVYYESEEEKKELNHLINTIEDDLAHNSVTSPFRLITLGAYRLLNNFCWAKKLLDNKWSPDINKLFIEQIKNIETDLSIYEQIPNITSINKVSSKIVRKQYESNPYPRWVKTDIFDKPRNIQNALRIANISIPKDIKSQSNIPDVLIAGCGTGQNAINTASRFQNCHVLAIDLSLNSLSYAIRKTKELDIKNIKYLQGDILELHQLNSHFDIIESVGVLHHLNNPLSGLKILTDKLRINGLMKIGLYSETARQSLIEAQQYVLEKKYKPTPDNIRQCRNDFFKMATNSNLKMTEILDYNDFYSLSECRDLLFPAVEHRFTLLQINEFLNELNLTFIGFEFNNNIIRKKFLEVFPYNNALLSLPLWHRFELNNPEAFGGMYQFWVQKN